MTDTPPNPVRSGTGRWRISLHYRMFYGARLLRATQIAELSEARTRRLETAFKTSATFSFTIPGRGVAASQIKEMEHEVAAWRFDDSGYGGGERLMFRGVVTQTQDTITENVHTVTVTCHDYWSFMQRRFLTEELWLGNVPQQVIVSELFRHNYPPQFGDSGNLPIGVAYCDPDGTLRPYDRERPRDRRYPAQTSIGEAVDNLSNVIGGFDYGLECRETVDWLRVYYPYQGVLRPESPLVYGFNVSSLTRSVNSANYANYVRVSGQADETQFSPPAAEAWNDDAGDLVSNPTGLWMRAISLADVKEQATLAERAAGAVASFGILVPSYSLVLRPGAWKHEMLNIGDVTRLVVRSGRLDVDSWIRVVGITYAIGDDGEGDEEIRLSVGRPDVTFADLFTYADRRVSALERR